MRLPVDLLIWVKNEAVRNRMAMTAVIEGVLKRHRAALGNGQGSEAAGGVNVRCPMCGADAFYSRPMDRFVHIDGSANQDCWRRMTSGEKCGCDGECLVVHGEHYPDAHEPCNSGMHMTPSGNSGTACLRCSED